jgi:hypothetical protein
MKLNEDIQWVESRGRKRLNGHATKARSLAALSRLKQSSGVRAFGPSEPARETQPSPSVRYPL